MTMKTYETELLNFCGAKRHCPETVEKYKSLLRKYEGFCYHEGVDVEEMPHEGLMQFMAESKSESEAKQRKAMLCILYEFILGQGFKLYGLPNPIQRVKVPESLSPEEIQRLFDAVPKTYEGRKQLLILKIIYACGLRVHEGVKIKKNDFRQKFSMKTGRHYLELKIKGKGAKERLVPVPDETANEIFAHIENRKVADYLFPGQFAEHYSKKSVQLVFMRAKIAAGITTPGNTHLLRKSRTSRFVDGQMNDRTIMKFFGWKSQKTMDHYHAANTGAMKDAIDNLDAIEAKALQQNPIVQIPNRFQKQVAA